MNDCGQEQTGSLLTFGLDFDDTFTADPKLWRGFIVSAEARGHKVFIVSCRMNTAEHKLEMEQATGLKNRVILTSMSPKRWYCEETYGLKIDVWIDDYPDSVENGR